MTDLHEYDVRDPDQLIHDIAARVPLDAGRAYLALVRDVSTEQCVLRVDRIALPAEIFDSQEASERLRGLVESWPLPDWGREPPRHSAELVIVRPGLCVIGPNEGIWLTATRYVNPLGALWSMAQSSWSPSTAGWTS